MYGTKAGEISRTAEMYVDLCKQGRFNDALFMVFAANRFSPEDWRLLLKEVDYYTKLR